MKHSERARIALAHLPEVDPAIAALALWCRFRDGAGKTSTKGDTIFFGPEFPSLPISEQTGLISHHVLHVALRHSARKSAAHERYGAGFREVDFDLACDALVNEALLQAGHALPRPAVRAEEIVSLLPAEARPANVVAEWDADKLYAVLAAQSSGASDGEGEIERYARAQGFEPDLKSSSFEKAKADLWAGRVEQALRAGQRAGSGIGAVLARFGDLPRSVVPWEIKLRRLLNRALIQLPRQSHRRPARAWLARDALARQTDGAQPVFEPGVLREDRRPRLVVGLDTSSSISGAVLDMFASEAVSIARRTGAEVHLLGFDTEVHSRSRFLTSGALGKLALRQGGGTDYEAVLAEADALDPSLIVMLTDLDAPTQFAVSTPVLWAVPASPPNPPAFGEVLVMDDLA